MATKELKFTVFGTHEGVDKNAIGYKRTTQRQKYTKDYRKYLKWKSYIVEQFLSQTRYVMSKEVVLECSQKGYLVSPISKSKEKIKVDVKVFYKDFRHPDTDNVQKAVNDALFKEDKFVFGSNDFGYDKDKPRLEVKILFTGKLVA